MKAAKLHLLGCIVLSIIFFFAYWMFIYLMLDLVTFELSRSNINFSSAKMVYNMFIVSIILSFFLAEVLIALFVWNFKKNRKMYYIINLLHIPFIIYVVYYIIMTDQIIPLVKNW